jgi:hypothetical protein
VGSVAHNRILGVRRSARSLCLIQHKVMFDASAWNLLMLKILALERWMKAKRFDYVGPLNDGSAPQMAVFLNQVDVFEQRVSRRADFIDEELHTVIRIGLRARQI